MAAAHPVWRIRLGQLGPNLQEAAELADVLQEVSAHIKVTGLTRTLTARTSTSSGNPTHLSTKERVRRAVPLSIDAGNVPWSQLVAVVSSAALSEPSSPAAHLQPQVLEVNSGGAVYFLFFKLNPQPPQQQHQQQQRPRQEATRLKHSTTPHQEQQHPQQIVQQDTAASCHTGTVQPVQQAAAQVQQQQPALPPLLRLHEQRTTAREGVAVLKVGASRLAMQAEQFANELTRHLGIAAPDCRIVRQVGSSAAEWSAVLTAVQQLAEPQQATASGADSSTHPPSMADLQQAAAAAMGVGSSGGGSSSGGGGGIGSGCQVAGELLAELQHLPCFLLMEFVEGCKLSDTVAAVDPASADVGQLCEDVGRLFLLDMLLGNADRMSCPELGWRGNANNLLYAQSGSRHAGRAVAIDSCVARRPPALKASAEDAAVERLSQLMLAVPDVSLALLQQLLGALRAKQQRAAAALQQQQRRRQASLPGAVGLCSALSGVDSLAGGSHCGQAGDAAGSSQLLGSTAGGAASGQVAAGPCNEQQHSPHQPHADPPPAAAAAAAVFPSAAEAAVSVTQHSPDSSGLQLRLPVLGQPRACKTSLGGVKAVQDGTAAAGCCAEEAQFTQEEVACFLNGVRQCLDGVLQIKGLLEMVSAKIAEWIAAFVEDVVRLNPALLPTPASPGPGAPHLRTPKPSPRVSGRSSFTSIRLEPSCGAAAGGGAHSGGGTSLGGVFDAVAAGAGGTGGGTGGGAAGVERHTGGWSGGGAVGLSGSSFSSRLHAAATAAGGGGSAGGAGPGRLVLPQPLPAQQQRQQSPEPHERVQAAVSSGSSSPVPPVEAGEAAAAVRGGQQHAEAGVGSSDGCGGSSSTAAGTPPDSTPPRGLFKQLVGGSRGAKSPQPLSRRFAAIKAALCSPKHGSDSSSNTAASRQQHQADAAGSSTAPDPSDTTGDPCTPPPPAACGTKPTPGNSCSSGDHQQQHHGSSGTPCSPPSHGPHGSSPNGPGAGARSPLDGSRAHSSDLATAVAAALSPRANALQTEALAGLFGGRSLSAGGRLHSRSSNGAVVQQQQQQQQLDKGCHSFGGHSVGGHSSVGGASTGRASLNSVTEDGGEGGDGTSTLPCARRMTWTAAEGSPRKQGGAQTAAAAAPAAAGGATGGPSTTPPSAATAPAVADPLGVPTGWSSSPSAGLPPAAAARMQASHGNSSSNSSGSKSAGNAAPGNSSSSRNSSPLPAVQPGVGREAPAVAAAGVSPGGVDSFLHRSHNTRHLSFTSGGGAGGDAASSSNSNSPAAAVHTQHHQQQRSSSSSLQVLASLQLDATLASITQEARHDGALAERLVYWKKAFREKGGELSAAIASWQERHQVAAVLSTGFLDGSHPIVDAYELGVRLQHMLRRLTALAAGALVQAPITVLPRVFLGNAVAADSHHLLQYLGVTHVLNAAQELQLTPDDPAHTFAVLRVAIRDEEEEDVATHFRLARDWIDASLASGGAVLVHCHEGKSRSVTLLLAYLMLSRGLTLVAALAHMRAVHPKASPNAGFMAQLMVLDKQLHGCCSIQPSELPRAKPEARVCSICGTAAGVSYESLVRHTKAKHGLPAPPAAAASASAASPAASGGGV